jgi:hypothetical protein
MSRRSEEEDAMTAGDLRTATRILLDKSDNPKPSEDSGLRTSKS